MDDLTIPDDARIRKRVGSAIEAFKLAVFPAGYEAGAKRTKRKVRALDFFFILHISCYSSCRYLPVTLLLQSVRRLMNQWMLKLLLGMKL